MFTIDAHLDLSMNAMEWNSDLRQSVFDIREREKGWVDKPGRGMGTVAFPELRSANIGLVVATQIARYAPPESQLSGCNWICIGCKDDGSWIGLWKNYCACNQLWSIKDD